MRSPRIAPRTPTARPAGRAPLAARRAAAASVGGKPPAADRSGRPVNRAVGLTQALGPTRLASCPLKQAEWRRGTVVGSARGGTDNGGRPTRSTCQRPARAVPVDARITHPEYVATVAVVTSSPPFAEGGHLVMARELVRALREAGHAAGSSSRRRTGSGSRGAPTWRRGAPTSGLAHEEKPIDQVISLRFPGYAVQHPNHVLWLNHRMREYYDLWDHFSSHLSWKGRIKERTRRALIHRVDALPAATDAASLRDLRDRAGAAADSGAASSPTCSIRRRRRATTATRATATTCSACRGCRR